MGVTVEVGVAMVVALGVGASVEVGVLVAVTVAVSVADSVGVELIVNVGEGVSVGNMVRVGMMVNVGVGVSVDCMVGVAVGNGQASRRRLFTAVTSSFTATVLLMSLSRLGQSSSCALARAMLTPMTSSFTATLLSPSQSPTHAADTGCTKTTNRATDVTNHAVDERSWRCLIQPENVRAPDALHPKYLLLMATK